MSLNVSSSISIGGCQPHRHCGPAHSHGHCRPEHSDSPEAPQRNGFLDLLSSPFQALGLKGGNQNDKQYDKYLQANEASNLLKG